MSGMKMYLLGVVTLPLLGFGLAGLLAFVDVFITRKFDE